MLALRRESSIIKHEDFVEGVQAVQMKKKVRAARVRAQRGCSALAVGCVRRVKVKHRRAPPTFTRGPHFAPSYAGCPRVLPVARGKACN